MDDLLRAVGVDGISKSQVSRLCTELDAEVGRFRTRLGGTVSVRVAGCHVREGAAARAGALDGGGHRHRRASHGRARGAGGLSVGPSGDGAFWLGLPARAGDL